MAAPRMDDILPTLIKNALRKHLRENSAKNIGYRNDGVAKTIESGLKAILTVIEQEQR